LSDLLIIQAGLDTVALVQVRGLKGDLPAQPMKKHMALSLIRSRLWDPMDGPRLRALANELSGGMLVGPVSDDFMMAAFDRAMSPPESLIAVRMLATTRVFVSPYNGLTIGLAPASRQAPGKLVDQAVLRMSMEDRFKAALEVTKQQLGAAFADQIDALLTPKNLGIMAALLAIWAGGHAFGVSEVVDAILLIAGLVMLGMAAIDVAEKTIKALDLIANAQNRDDLRKAGLLFAEVIAIIGVQALLALLLWMAGKVGAKGKGSGKPPPDTPPPGPPKQLPEGPPPPKLLPRLARSPVEKLADGARGLPKQASHIEGARPGDVARMVTKDGAEVAGRSKFADTQMHPKLQQALDKVPEGSRSPTHGRCAEINTLNKALKDGKDVNGAAIQTAKVRGPNGPDHGKPHAPCSTCSQVLKELGVEYVP
jgi:hypothetical protein